MMVLLNSALLTLSALLRGVAAARVASVVEDVSSPPETGCDFACGAHSVTKDDITFQIGIGSARKFVPNRNLCLKGCEVVTPKFMRSPSCSEVLPGSVKVSKFGVTKLCCFARVCSSSSAASTVSTTTTVPSLPLQRSEEERADDVSQQLQVPSLERGCEFSCGASSATKDGITFEIGRGQGVSFVVHRRRCLKTCEVARPPTLGKRSSCDDVLPGSLKVSKSGGNKLCCMIRVCPAAMPTITTTSTPVSLTTTLTQTASTTASIAAITAEDTATTTTRDATTIQISVSTTTTTSATTTTTRTSEMTTTATTTPTSSATTPFTTTPSSAATTITTTSLMAETLPTTSTQTRTTTTSVTTTEIPSTTTSLTTPESSTTLTPTKATTSIATEVTTETIASATTKTTATTTSATTASTTSTTTTTASSIDSTTTTATKSSSTTPSPTTMITKSSTTETMTVTTVETPASASDTISGIAQADEDVPGAASSSTPEPKPANFYSCQEGQGESHKHYTIAPASTRGDCAALCNAEEEWCKAFDYGSLKRVGEGFCRLYGANKPRLGSTGEIKREYCQKHGTAGFEMMAAEKDARRFEGKYSCQEGAVEGTEWSSISFQQSDDASSLEACAALCDAEQECQAIDFSIAKSRLADDLRRSLMGKRFGSMCRIYKTKTTHLLAAGWDERRYCEKSGDEASHQ